MPRCVFWGSMIVICPENQAEKVSFCDNFFDGRGEGRGDEQNKKNTREELFYRL